MMQQHVHAKEKKNKLNNKNTGDKCLIKVIKSKKLEIKYLKDITHWKHKDDF